MRQNGISISQVKDGGQNAPTMELLFVLLALWVLVMPLVAVIMASGAGSRITDLERQLESLKLSQAPVPVKQPPVREKEADAISWASESASSPPPPAPSFAESPSSFVKSHPVPPPPPPGVLRPTEPVKSASPLPAISLEHFMGAKLFAWAGGLAMFLGIVFFVKLSLERGWISDEVRILIGLLVGASLVIGGVWAHRKPRFVVLGQTLCATGIVALYGVSFAAHQLTPVWPFEHVAVTFSFMAIITALAFVLAVRMEARVVAILGLLGGFLPRFSVRAAWTALWRSSVTSRCSTSACSPS